MTKKQVNEITKLLATIDIDVSLDQTDEFSDYDHLAEWLDDNDFLNVDVIYYSRAIEYLSEHDPSLKNSLELAHDMGYSFDGLTSEVLASLLATANLREELAGLEDDINEVLEG